MPSNVKVFFALSIALVAFWTCSTVWYLFHNYHDFIAFPHATYDDWQSVIGIDPHVGALIFWGSITLLLAWLAAFRRKNWARWAFILIFLFRKFTQLATAYVFGQGCNFIVGYAPSNWLDPGVLAVPLLTITATFFIFSGNAKSWFSPSSTQA